MEAWQVSLLVEAMAVGTRVESNLTINQAHQMSKQIRCTACNANLGEIRDASIRKDTRYICAKCDGIRLNALVELHRLRQADPFDSFFDNLFKGNKR